MPHHCAMNKNSRLIKHKWVLTFAACAIQEFRLRRTEHKPLGTSFVLFLHATLAISLSFVPLALHIIIHMKLGHNFKQ